MTISTNLGKAIGWHPSFSDMANPLPPSLTARAQLREGEEEMAAGAATEEAAEPESKIPRSELTNGMK